MIHRSPLLFVTRDNPQGRYLAHALAMEFSDLYILVEDPVAGSLKKIRAQFKLIMKNNSLSALCYLFELPILALIEMREQAQIEKELSAPKKFPEGKKIARVSHINDQNTWRYLSNLSPISTLVYGSSIIGHTSLSRMGKVLNCHMGIVPQYRGAKSEFWAIHNKDKDNLGFSIHECVEKLDAGHVIEQVRLPLGGNAANMRAKSLIKLSETLPKVWIQYLEGQQVPMKQIGEPCYYSTPRLWDRLRVFFGHCP